MILPLIQYSKTFEEALHNPPGRKAGKRYPAVIPASALTIELPELPNASEMQFPICTFEPE